MNGTLIVVPSVLTIGLCVDTKGGGLMPTTSSKIILGGGGTISSAGLGT